MKDEFSPTSSCVDILGDALKANFSIVKLGDGVNEMLQRTA